MICCAALVGAVRFGIGASAVVALLPALATCQARWFSCEADAQCRIDAVQGRCSDGYCSYPDGECPSGQRWHRSAPDGIAGRCVDEADDASGSGGTGACGDGVVDPDEACDDGNERDGDGCNRDCRPSGEPIWERTFQGDDPGQTRDDRAYRVAIDRHDEIVVVGEASVADARQNIFIRKYSRDGEERWTRQPGKAGDDEAWAVHIADDDSITVGGYVTDPDTGRDFWLASFDAAGDERWQYQLDAAEIGGFDGDPSATSDDEIRGVVFSSPDRIVVVGKSFVGNAEDRFAASGTVSDAGIVLGSWALAAGEVPGEWDDVADVDLVGDTYVLTGARTYTAGAPKSLWLGWFREDGTPELDVAVDPPGYAGTAGAQGRRLRATSEGVVFAGSVGGFETEADGFYGAVDAGGTTLWSRTHDGPTSRRDYAHGVAVDAEGNVIVVGESGGDPLDGGTVTETSAQVWITKLAPDLSELWSDVYNGPENERDVAFDVATDSEGAIVVVGYQSVAGNDYDLWVRKYRP